MAKGIDGLGEVRELYDQSSTEDGEVGADGVLTGPFKYDKVPDTYYIEVTWDGYVIANDVEFTVNEDGSISDFGDGE